MRTSADHRAEYERRLHRVFAYIDAHLDEPLDVATLAREASFSPFHFHRLFSAHTGETIGAYLTRRRVEQAAARLGAQPRVTVLTMALSVGFGSAEAFSRAFKKHFGCSPSQWKTVRRRGAAKHSKLSQANRNLDQAATVRTRYGKRTMKTTLAPLQVAVANRPAVRFAYLRYQGPFGPAVGRFWGEKVYPWLAANNLLGAPRYGICHDDPAVTDSSKLRYDAGAEVGKDFVPSQGAQLGTTPAGLYASTRFFGTSQEIPAIWDRLLREWLPASGYQLDARPCFEYYPPDGEMDEKTGAFTCDLCMPVAKL
jgi:AraC family transcriptional regulator